MVAGPPARQVTWRDNLVMLSTSPAGNFATFLADRRRFASNGTMGGKERSRGSRKPGLRLMHEEILSAGGNGEGPLARRLCWPFLITLPCRIGARQMYSRHVT